MTLQRRPRVILNKRAERAVKSAAHSRLPNGQVPARACENYIGSVRRNESVCDEERNNILHRITRTLTLQWLLTRVYEYTLKYRPSTSDSLDRHHLEQSTHVSVHALGTTTSSWQRVRVAHPRSALADSHPGPSSTIHRGLRTVAAASTTASFTAHFSAWPSRPAGNDSRSTK